MAVVALLGTFGVPSTTRAAPAAEPAPVAEPAPATDPAPVSDPASPPAETTDPASAGGWGPEDEAAPAPVGPAATPVPPVASEAAPAAPALPPSPEGVERERRLKRAKALVISGIVLTAVGGTTLIFFAGGAALAAEIAEDRADSDPVLVSEQELRDRVRNRRRFAVGSAIVGGVLVLGGVGLMGGGFGLRARLRDEPTATAFYLPGGGGLAVTGRF